jgi:hypothetical protein
MLREPWKGDQLNQAHNTPYSMPDLRFSVFALYIDTNNPALLELLSANFENIWFMED